ncbi:muc1 extracellular alpha glucan glucosidase-like [Penicillium digitatum]|uniref:Uncharacterized protein n=3 Tax=Penicillium digitatum TaxID=36651 RepID=K9F407_PEND2|nr:hypothetical protein PDIP_88420 [Penicillium digitatum Pd1]EKV04020.1 hypothetical protein PDIG_91370 [Penicillium digitatum PHI26]EKV04233.1 hypothetical protein PDIP_88420 [Penicillium digitatum Pd1]QQK48468.1 muc1 extracellular alpha glucan glucosidase-like [Penicillium digitatum]
MRGNFILSLLSAALGASAAVSQSNLKAHVDVLALDYAFNPVKAAYWTGYPHHRRTPFAVSPDGKSAYIAYLDSSATDVHVQQLDPTTFAATGTTVTVSGGKEAGGLVAHNDGFALLTNEALPSGTTNAPPSGTPVPVLYRYTSGKQTWKTWLGGPGVHESEGLSASPDLNGDLVYSESAQLYGAYFVVTDYTGDASGHFGDSVEYISASGKLESIAGASSAWGCSHNTGIAFEAADDAPFAGICAEDQGAIWLNTKTQGMSTDGIKISNENTTNGASGEPMGGMSGSYSVLARFADTTKYIFAWVSRGAIDVTENAWMGTGYTNVQNRTNGRNVAISLFSDKYTKVGAQATSDVGVEDGDSQVNWVTSGSNDCSNAHAATFGNNNALVTWEEISNPTCDFIAMGCRGIFAGTYFQQVDSTGSKVGEPFSANDVYVAGDMVTMSDGRICWPYVNMIWDLSQPIDDSSSSGAVKKMSIACMALDGATGFSTTAATSATSSSTAKVAVNKSASAVTKAVSSATTIQPQSNTSGATSSAATIDATSQTTKAVSSATTIDATSQTTKAVAEASNGGVAAIGGGSGNASSSSVIEIPMAATSATASAIPSSSPTRIASATPSGTPTGIARGHGRKHGHGWGHHGTEHHSSGHHSSRFDEVPESERQLGGACKSQ